MSRILWKPSAERLATANITRFMAEVKQRFAIDVHDYDTLYRWSIDNREAFWDSLWEFSGVVAQHKGDVVLVDGDRMPGAKWFPGARLNYAENLLKERNGEERVIIFWREDRLNQSITFGQLYTRVAQLVQAMRHAGIKPGDRVAAVLPNMPETVIAMLASASVGAVWTCCSPDFGVQAIVDRLGQVQPKILFISDGYFYNGRSFSICEHIEPVIESIASFTKTVLIPYIGAAPVTGQSLVTPWSEFVAGFSRNGPIDFAHLAFDQPLFILYSSGTTGPPKCIVHGAGGTLLQHLKEHLLHVDIQPGERLFYFTTCGWMMWNWLVSGLAAGATLVLYDGSPTFPTLGALFEMVDELGIETFGVSAKYIDAIKKSGYNPEQACDLSSLKTVLSTGSPLLPESFDFVYDAIKSDVCLSSISGGTDIISCFVLGCPILPVRRGEIQCCGLGMKVEVFDESGEAIHGRKGELVCAAPFPSMPVGFWNDPDENLYRGAYFDRYPGIWRQGDYAELTDSGGLIIYGRSDAILNPGGVRIGTAEIYRQVEQIDEVLESLVIGQDWQGDCRVVLFVALRSDIQLTEDLRDRIKRRIRSNASPRHVPAKIIQVSDIPRTRSGKIVELAVREIAHGRTVKNLHALANPESLDQFRDIADLRI